jgi:hypothetical protein
MTFSFSAMPRAISASRRRRSSSLGGPTIAIGRSWTRGAFAAGGWIWRVAGRAVDCLLRARRIDRLFRAPSWRSRDRPVPRPRRAWIPHRWIRRPMLGQEPRRRRHRGLPARVERAPCVDDPAARRVDEVHRAITVVGGGEGPLHRHPAVAVDEQAPVGERGSGPHRDERDRPEQAGGDLHNSGSGQPSCPRKLRAYECGLDLRSGCSPIPSRDVPHVLASGRRCPRYPVWCIKGARSRTTNKGETRWPS